MHFRRSKLLRIASLFLLTLVLVLAPSSSAFSNVPSQEPPPPTEIWVGEKDHGRQIELRQGQVLVVALLCNPSTGYTWLVDASEATAESAAILRQTEKSEFVPISSETSSEAAQSELHLLGAPATQLLRFEAVSAGETVLELVYRRSWEGQIAPDKAFSLHVRGVGSFSSADVPATTGPLESSLESPPPSKTPPDLGYPPAFNWCALGGCPPIRDQVGDCGSCWAFSTVALLESQILLQDGILSNLSEQYLISCNTDDFGCGGGWFAHDYHEWKIPPGELEAGAVLEADFPYVWSDVQCNGPYTHHERIASWHYVQEQWGNLDVAAIQDAIIHHGPVATGICVGDDFTQYTGGIFNTNECGTHNHAVVLVGWDGDQGTDGVWILRNSWGEDWGEAGYMRIEYGTSDVGYAANYVVYSPPCHTLYLTTHPDWGGTITADPQPDCASHDYQPGTEVELTANAAAGWHFTGWSGDASGSVYTTTVTMNADKSVAAHFLCDDCPPRAHVPLAVKEYPEKGSWVTILTEDFEGAFPGVWSVEDNQPAEGEYFWGKRSCRPYEGTSSGWAVGDRSSGPSLSCGDYYPEKVDSWMVYGPFGLVDALAADLQIKLWVSTERDYDYACRVASIDGNNFYGNCTSGNSGGWIDMGLDLSDVYTLGSLLGEPQVWIALVFDSDGTVNNPEGAYVDNIVLRKYASVTGAAPPLTDTPGPPSGDPDIVDVPTMRVRVP
jgi:C1A family cysteine protease